MKNILIICYVAAEFVLNGQRFSVTPGKIGCFIEAPAWIRDTIMFKWLVKDGSLKVSNEHITKKQGENDPMKGMSAEGKTMEISKAAEDTLMKPKKEAEEPAEEPQPLIKEAKPKKEAAEQKPKKNRAPKEEAQKEEVQKDETPKDDAK